MNRFLKVALYILVIFIFLAVLSPFVSLMLPGKLTNRTYYRLIYRIIADKETAGCFTEEEKALKLLQYVVNHEFLQGIPYECKPAESLIYAEAYCDFQARTLNELLGVIGIPCRYAMLLDKDGISPHTLNEVFLHNKWCVFDLSMNIVFRDNSMKMVSLDELSDNPGLIFNNKKLVAFKEYDKKGYANTFAWYSRMFPMPASPRRSTPVMYKYHIFDYICDAYFKIFKYIFSNFYQDAYLRLNKNHLKERDLVLLFKARNYHLCYRQDLALEYYDMLLKEYPQSKYLEDDLFFRGELYFDIGDFHKAIESFGLITDKYPKWRNAAYLYLGRSYGLIGDTEKSLAAYNNANIFNLSAETIEELNKRGFQKH